MIPKPEKMYQMIPNVHKVFPKALKYIDNLPSKALQNLPELGFLVRKETIWQPCNPMFPNGKKCLALKLEVVGLASEFTTPAL
jgi:hypothetical protein